MKDDQQITFEVIKLIVSLLTPILVVFSGWIISRKIEKNKLDLLKEKEWQVKWAELFLKHATEFNDNISSLICLLFFLQNETDRNKSIEQLNKIKTIQTRLSEIDWNIRNYAQFSQLHGKKVMSTQEILLNSISKFISDKKGDLEKFRTQQFEYNSAIRNAHNEILNMK